MKPNQISVIRDSIRPLLSHLDLSLLQNKSLFITGGTGFFGLWLLSALELIQAQGAAMRVVVLSRDPNGFLYKQPRWKECSWLNFVQGDIKNFVMPDQSFDLMIHAATDVSVEAHADPIAIFNDTAEGSRRALDFAVRAKVKRALFTSSGAVYGRQPADMLRIPDDSTIACSTSIPHSAYGEGKRVMEFLASAYHYKYGIETVSARCFALVGPGLPLDQHFAIGNFIRDALQEDQIRIRGDGTAVRSYLYAADLAIWLLKLLLSGATCTNYNVGSDQYLNLKDLARRVADIISPGKPVVVESQAPLSIDLRSVYVPAIDLARQTQELDVWTPLDKAIELTAEFHSKAA
jgi:nucleoside-diphosphate-sugar epimerase